ncbi:MAG: aminodeoxychorismate synthase component I [Methylophilaceae bacterium]
MTVLRHSLNYHHDSARLFSRIALEHWAMFLDSGQAIDSSTGNPGSQYGHYDILVAKPIATLVTDGDQTMITEDGQTHTSSLDPFSLLNDFLSRYQAEEVDVPFAGGAMGYFAYDLGWRLEEINDKNKSEDIPEMMIGIYDWAVVVDHRKQSSVLISHGFSENTRQNWALLCDLFEAPYEVIEQSFEATSDPSCNFTEATYTQAFNQVKSYIKSGDCYQVNLAQRFSAQVQGDSWTAYKKLRDISPAPFMAYMQFPHWKSEKFSVLSNSPERFIQVVSNHVETRPIKGTMPRSEDPVQDAAYAKALQESSKDQAENLMIVDLLRSDIGKNCITGSVKVEKLFLLQSFANVHHLVSIVTAKLKEGATVIDLLKGCFPGGSITGAPKVRSMQIIEELEPNRRGVYCGAIGYIGFDGKMDTNIAIRTAVICNGELSYYAGGGIVDDSISRKEYLETLDKAATIAKLIKSCKRHCL